MAAMTVPPTCAVALKEWASVLEAMGRGDQLVLIRKGGLIEPGSGFELLSPQFVFYPTFEHQTLNYLRADYQPIFEHALTRRAPEGQVRIELFGMAVSTTQTRDPQVIERISSFHIYNDAFVSQRLKWQPDQPLVIVIVRAFRLPAPCTLDVIPRYAGCKSWVDLDSSVPLEGVRPVLDDATFRERMRAVNALLSPP